MTRKGPAWTEARLRARHLAGALAVLVAGTGTVPAGAASDLRAQGPSIVLELPWGDGEREAGRLDGDEAASEGPMSFSITPSGGTLLLDQVNERVLRFDAEGEQVGAYPIPGDTFQDICAAPGERMVLLDRLVRQSLLVLEADGSRGNEFGVLGPAIPEGGGLTAMLWRDDGVWLEYAHTHAVRALTPELEPAAGGVVAGRPAREDGTALVAALDGEGGVRLGIERTGQAVVSRTMRLAMDVDRIIWLEADEEGNVYLALHLVEYAPDGIGLWAEEVVVLRLDARLNDSGAFHSPHGIVQWEQFREFLVTPDGAVYQMAFTASGVVILRWEWRR